MRAVQNKRGLPKKLINKEKEKAVYHDQKAEKKLSLIHLPIVWAVTPLLPAGSFTWTPVPSGRVYE